MESLDRKMQVQNVTQVQMAIRENKAKQTELIQQIEQATQEPLKESLQSDLNYAKEVYNYLSERLTALVAHHVK